MSFIIRSSSIHLSLRKDTLEEGMGCYNTTLRSPILESLLESERGFETKYMLGLSSTLWAGKCLLSLIAKSSPLLSETWETKSLWPSELMLMRSAPITTPVLLSKSMARLNKYLSLVTDFNDAALKQPKGDFYHWKWVKQSVVHYIAQKPLEHPYNVIVTTALLRI